MIQSRSRIVLFSLLVLISGLTSAAVARELTLEPCRLTSPSGLGSVAAECGLLEVALNPAEPEAGIVGLSVARIAALNPATDATPLTLLAGGPGQAASDFYASYAPAFERIRRHHDIFLVDQRGTGNSHALDCEGPDEIGEEFSLEAVRRSTIECLEALDTDPAFFTTSLAVNDLDQVRVALGYESINLYGASYGTRVALHYLRRFPQHTRAVILDGAVPADHALGPGIALNAQHALDLLFERCLQSSACHETFPDIEASFSNLLEVLRVKPQHVVLQHPVTGKRVSFDFGALELAMSTRLLSYSPQTSGLLPLLIDQAYREDNLVPLAAQALMESESIARTLSLGMHNTIVCSEDVPFYDHISIDRAALAQTYLGTLQLDALTEICRHWPVGPVDEDFKDPVVSDMPVLILSGSADPITPPSMGEQIAATLGNALHVIGQHQGHGMLAVGCVPRLMTQFIDNASVDGLDTSCVAEARSASFFISFSGPKP